MSKKNLVGGIVLAGAAAAAAAAVVVAKKITDSKADADQPIRLHLDEDEVTEVVLEDLDGDSQEEPQAQVEDDAEPEIEIELVISEPASEEPESPQE